MDNLRSINEVNLVPDISKTFWSCDRRWEEDVIYHLLVDRFHDGLPSVATRK